MFAMVWNPLENWGHLNEENLALNASFASFFFLTKQNSTLFIYWLRQVLVASLGIFVAVRRLSCPVACGILVPQQGVQPMSPALEGRFLTTGPPTLGSLHWEQRAVATGPPGKSPALPLYRSVVWVGFFINLKFLWQALWQCLPHGIALNIK